MNASIVFSLFFLHISTSNISAQITYDVSSLRGSSSIEASCRPIGKGCFSDSECCTNYCVGPYGICNQRPCHLIRQSCGSSSEFECCPGLYCDGTLCALPLPLQYYDDDAHMQSSNSVFQWRTFIQWISLQSLFTGKLSVWCLWITCTTHKYHRVMLIVK